MVDSGIKKVSIPTKDLPSINPNTEGYEIRYRIVSEDKNRTSHWSPIHIVKPEFTYVPGTIHANSTSDIVTVAWNDVDIYKGSTYIRTANEYDIWVMWDRDDGGDWLYRSRVAGTGVTLLVPDTYYINGVDQLAKPNHVTVEVYLKGDPITRDTDFLLVYGPAKFTA